MNTIAAAVGKRIIALAGWEFLVLAAIAGVVYTAVESRRSREREATARIRAAGGSSIVPT